MTTKSLSPNSRTGYEILSHPSNQKVDQTQPLRIVVCAFCGHKVTTPAKGRKRTWCSDACKSHAWRLRQSGYPYPTAFAKANKPNPRIKP